VECLIYNDSESISKLLIINNACSNSVNSWPSYVVSSMCMFSPLHYSTSGTACRSWPCCNTRCTCGRRPGFSAARRYSTPRSAGHRPSRHKALWFIKTHVLNVHIVTRYNQSVTGCSSQQRQGSCYSTKTHVNSMILILRLNLTSLRNTYIKSGLRGAPHTF